MAAHLGDLLRERTSLCRFAGDTIIYDDCRYSAVLPLTEIGQIFLTQEEDTATI